VPLPVIRAWRLIERIARGSTSAAPMGSSPPAEKIRAGKLGVCRSPLTEPLRHPRQHEYQTRSSPIDGNELSGDAPGGCRVRATLDSRCPGTNQEFLAKYAAPQPGGVRPILTMGAKACLRAHSQGVRGPGSKLHRDLASGGKCGSRPGSRRLRTGSC
jgi:hypothetical protein